MKFEDTIYVDGDLGGDWNEKAKVNSSVDKDKCNKFFAKWIEKDEKDRIISTSTDDDIGYVVTADLLNDFCKDQILKQVMDGNMSGTVIIDGESLEWSWAPEVTLAGITVDLHDALDNETVKEITKQMLWSDKYTNGGYFEEWDSININVSIDDDTLDIDDDPSYGINGVVSIETKFAYHPELNTIENVNFYYDEDIVEFNDILRDNDYRPGDNLPDHVDDDIITFIKSTCRSIVKAYDRSE